MAMHLPAADDGDELVPWQLDAACRGEPVATFFPDSPDQVPPEVLALCSMCEVRDECLTHALAHEPYGIWGGMSEKALGRLRKIQGVTLGPAGYAGRAAELHRAGWTIDDIAVELETTTRSIARYLEDAGDPLTPEDDHRRRPRIEESA